MMFDAPKDTSQQMADLLPDGRAWGKKNHQESNTRKLINSLAVAHNKTQQQVELLANEFDILQAVDLFVDWEKSVGLPDSCVFDSQTLKQRRQNVIDVLKRKSIVSLQDFQDFVDALLPGFGVILFPGYEYYTFEYSFESPFLGDVNEKFILVAEVPLSDNQFEYDFEIEFEGGVDTTALECILSKIIPANVVLIIELRG